MTVMVTVARTTQIICDESGWHPLWWFVPRNLGNKFGCSVAIHINMDRTSRGYSHESECNPNFSLCWLITCSSCCSSKSCIKGCVSGTYPASFICLVNSSSSAHISSVCGWDLSSATVPCSWSQSRCIWVSFRCLYPSSIPSLLLRFPNASCSIDMWNQHTHSSILSFLLRALFTTNSASCMLPWILQAPSTLFQTDESASNDILLMSSSVSSNCPAHPSKSTIQP